MSLLPRAFPFALGLAAATLLTAVVQTASADDLTDKQKKASEARLKLGEITTFTFVETGNLLVFATLPQDKTKTLATTLQKTYTIAAKALAYGEKDEPWKGKLSVYYIPDRKQFTLFVLKTANEKPSESHFFSLRGDEPHAVLGTELGAKSTEAKDFGDAAASVGAALLTAKAGAGATVPEWVRFGFGQAASYRAEGTMGKRASAFRAEAKKAVLGGGGRPPAALASVWEGNTQESEVLGISLMDFLAFGPKKEDFPRVVSGFRPNENNQTPSPQQAFEGAGWKLPALDLAWKKWVQSGK